MRTWSEHMYINLRKMIYWAFSRDIFLSHHKWKSVHFFNNSLGSVTTVTQTQIIFIVNYDMHILQNLCVI